jgi:hypothetical protein
MLLCLTLFDDAVLRRILPARLLDLVEARAKHQTPRRAATIAINAVAMLMVFLSLVQMDERFGGSPPGPALAIDDLFEPFHIVSPYGLFSVMTTTRNEIIVEGSDDGEQWREYEFRYKPAELTRRPLWNIAHQPRLDWQMWFAALDDAQRSPWFSRFLERLLENEPSVIALLERNPFPDRPPIYVRAELYDYTYAGNDDHAGRWWNRRLTGLYFPKARLKSKDE